MSATLPLSHAADRRPASRSTRALTVLHTRYIFLETVRIPMAVIGSLAFPALSMLFFVVPMKEVAGSPVYATEATVGLCYFAVMANCLFSFGVGVADDRARPWDPYLRTLPVSAGPRVGARVVNGLVMALLSLVPLLVIAWALTEATVTPGRFVGSLGLLAVGALPFLFGGLAIGYLLSAKAALAVAQVLMFAFAFGGGLFLPPAMFPSWLDTLSQAFPTRAGRELVLWAATGTGLPSWAPLCLLAWTALTLAAALWGYQRDEGRRFR